ncbi:class I SAM-dependent methyltransferase [Pseudomonas putida]
MNDISQVLKKEYQARFEGQADYRNGVWSALCATIFSKHIPPESTVLDLGAGWGEFTNNIQAKKKYAMDLNPDCGQNVAGRAEFLHQDCSSRWPLENDSLDVVFTSNFLEHLPAKDIIDRTLEEAFRCLKPGGKIICVGPNIKYLPGLYWDYWDHYTPISDASMAEALSLRGFKITQNIDRFLPYTMSNGKQPPLFAVTAYLRMPFVWKYFGKQFFVIAQK